MRRLAIALLAAVAMLLIGAPTAHALPGVPDCKEAPTPEIPGRGWQSWLLPEPKTPPRQADPFTAHPTTTIYEQYGLAGFEFHTYDLGCSPAQTEPAQTGLANLAKMPGMFGLALLGGLSHLAYRASDWLGLFDKPLEGIIGAIKDAVWTPLAAPMFLMLCLVIGVKFRRKVSRAAGAAVVALLIVATVAVVFAQPVKLAHATDHLQAETVGGLASAVAGVDDKPADVAITSTAVDALLWPRWLARNFGDPDSEAAKRYGPELFKAGALTWSEAARYNQDPGGEGARILDQKRSDWEQTAERVHQMDQDAYDYLKGEHGGVGEGLGVSLSVWVALILLLAALVVTVAAYIIVRFAVMLFAAIAVIAVLPQTNHLAKAPLAMVGAALLNSTIFTVGAMFNLLVIRAIYAMPISGGAQFVLAALTAAILWVALRPFRKLTRMVHKYDAAGEMSTAWQGAKSRAGDWSSRFTATALAGATGGASAAAGAAAMSTQGDDTPPPQGAPAAAQQPRTPIPAPTMRHPELDRANTVFRPGEHQGTPRTVDPDGNGVYPLYDSRSDSFDWDNTQVRT